MELHRPVFASGRCSDLGGCLLLFFALFLTLEVICQAIDGQDCVHCVTDTAHQPANSQPVKRTGDWFLTKQVNEVNLLFIATRKGKSVSSLSVEDVSVLDDKERPAAILDFRSDRDLALRLGVAIDTSGSVTSRFRYEQAAASAFFRQVMTRKGDLGFVMGFSNDATLAQDFVDDPDLLAEGVRHLTIGGATALYDAVRTACQKMLLHDEQAVVARVLVVLSDGENNFGDVTLERAIAAAQESEVIVYTISTNIRTDQEPLDLGDKNLRKLAEETGGRALFGSSSPEVARAFGRIGEELRSRYSISYRPAHFVPNGNYRRIKIEDRLNGAKLKVRARKGYYAGLGSSFSPKTGWCSSWSETNSTNFQPAVAQLPSFRLQQRRIHPTLLRSSGWSGCTSKKWSAP